jgi:hypothetical protein
MVGRLSMLEVQLVALILLALIFGTVGLGLLAYCSLSSSFQPLKKVAVKFVPTAIGTALLFMLGTWAYWAYWEWSWNRLSQRPSYILHNLGMGLLNYESAYASFPPPALQQHSWRIRVVPFLISSPHYSEYDFGVPWDASRNMLIDRRPLRVGKGPDPDDSHVSGMPFEFGHDLDFPQQTRFVMIVGEGFFGSQSGGRRPSEIVDGLVNTIAIAETSRSDIHWLHPLDLNGTEMSLRVNDGPNSIGSTSGRMPCVCFGDGQVFYLSPKIPASALKALLTINGREEVSRDACIRNGWLVVTE